MNKLKDVFFAVLMLVVVSMFSCSKSEGEEPTVPPGEGGGDAPEETVDFAKELCDGSRFIKRTYKDFSTAVIGSYSALTTQHEYLFSKDGSGVLTTYVADKTPRGFTASTKQFTWTASNKKPISLNVSAVGGESFTMADAKIDDNKLTSNGEALSKEITVEGVIKKEEVVSYKVYTTSVKSTDEFGRLVLLRSPSRIEVKTKTGIVSFITYEYGTQAVQVGVPCYSKDGGPLTYYDCDVYVEVDTKNPYKYSFCQVSVSKDKMTFADKNKMYFYMGSFSKDTSAFTLIENGKEYEVNN